MALEKNKLCDGHSAIDRLRTAFINSLEQGANVERKGVGFADPVVQALWDAYLCGFNSGALGDTGSAHLRLPLVMSQAVPAEVHRALYSKDLYQVLMDAQNGIDSPATSSLANGAIQLVEKARASVVAQPRAQVPRPQNCGTGHCSCIECSYEAQVHKSGARETLVDYVTRSTHWKEGGATRHDALLALKQLDATQEQPLPPVGWRELAQRCLTAMEQAVRFRETGVGRPPEQTCMSAIEDLRNMLATHPKESSDLVGQMAAIIEAESKDLFNGGDAYMVALCAARKCAALAGTHIQPPRHVALEAKIKECNMLNDALNLACSYLTDDQVEEVKAAMPGGACQPAPNGLAQGPSGCLSHKH